MGSQLKSSNRIAFLAAVALATAAIVVGKSMAFKPDKHTFGHTRITETVLSKAGYAYGSGSSVTGWTTKLSDSTTVSFSDDALQTVVLGVQAVDFVNGQTYNKDGVEGWVYGEISTEEAHCDNDKTDSCSRRIINIRGDGEHGREGVASGLLKYVNTADKFQLINARLMLGRALHTLQDFYAHSNYAENHASGPIYAALTTDSAAVAAARPSGTRATCTAEGEPFNSTWTVNGGNYKLIDAGTETAIITSGYFFNSNVFTGMGSAPDTAGVSRCDHGIEAVNVVLGGTVSGINKDAPYSPFVPSPYYADYTVNEEIIDSATRASPLHLRASLFAAQHTSKFLDEVIVAIKAKTSDVTKQDAMIAALLGVDLAKPVIGFVIDDTGSMGDIISGVKANIQRAITEATTANPDSKFLVLRYGDPDVGAATIGTAAQVATVIAGISAHGGGDCPEMTNSGILAALKAAPPKSKLLVFTDASSKDSSLAAQVTQLALDKKIVVQYSVSGSCSPIDPSYYAVAAATGGQVLVTEHSSASVQASFVGVSIEAAGYASRPVVIERGTSSSVRAIDIVVDSGATALAVTGTFDTGTFALQDPSGGAVTSSTVGATITDFIGGRGYSLRSPTPGIWKAVLTPVGSSAYSLNANVTSTLDIAGLGFSADASVGRAGHEASLPFLSGPPAGASARLELRLNATSGITANAFTLINESGTVLASPVLVDIGAGIYVGPVQVPAEPFRVRASGVDASGRTFTRIAPSLITPRRYTVALPESPLWVAGSENSLRISIANYGSAGAFSVAAALNGISASVSKPSMTIAANAVEIEDITVAIPAGTAASIQKLALKISIDGATETLNIPLQVLADSDGDGVPDVEESGADGAQADFDGNGDGIPDRLQATVISLHSRQGTAYITASIDGSGRFASAGARSIPLALGSGGSATFPVELLGVSVVGLTGGASTKIVIRLPEYLAAVGFSGYGALSTGAAEGVYPFDAVGAPSAQVSGSLLTLTLTDGARGDSDLSANGQIVLLGGPTGVDIKGVNHIQSATPAPQPESSSGGGGGCTIGSGPGDWTLVILASIAGGLAWQRRKPLVSTRLSQPKRKAGRRPKG